MPRRLTLLALTVLLLLVSYGYSAAQEVIIPINHFPPWKITDGDRIDGINIILTRKLLDKVDLTPEFVARPWNRGLSMMKKGQADMMNGILKRPEREEYMIYIDPPYKSYSTKAFYVLKGRSLLIRKYEDLKGLSIGTTLGSKFFHRFDEDTSLIKDAVKDNVLNIKKLLVGRIDTFIATETVADYMIKQQGAQDQIEKAEFIYSSPNPVYFTVSRKSPLAEKVPELSAALRELVESGEVDTIIKEFINTPPPLH
ncbi:substrate-binding periplasmic protein [Maridesulfovibrio sp. FT414]|uniref:substrate-binding periplasmic protein n=1 Tax=Maridesulfovibrio sp. FT414 TaxID=2979469 RepID=UPI003D809FC2